jgi:hypothetical protein
MSSQGKSLQKNPHQETSSKRIDPNDAGVSPIPLNSTLQTQRSVIVKILIK